MEKFDLEDSPKLGGLSQTDFQTGKQILAG